MARPLLLDLALTHILGRKRQTIVSVMGVALGVGFFIAMAALMQGFQGYFVETVINASPHITVRDQFREPAVQPVATRQSWMPTSRKSTTTRSISRPDSRPLTGTMAGVRPKLRTPA